MFSREEGKASTEALTPAPRNSAHEVFSLREALHRGWEHAHNGAGVSHMWLQHTDEDAGRTALRSEVTGHHRVAHLSRQTVSTDAVTKTCGRMTARRNNNVMKANSGKVRKRGNESHVISGGELLRHSPEQGHACSKAPSNFPFGVKELYAILHEVVSTC